MSVSAIEKIMETAFYASEDNSLKYKLSPLSSGTQLSSSAPRRKRFFGSASLVRASIMYPVMMLGWLIFIFLYCILPVGNNSFLVPVPVKNNGFGSSFIGKKRVGEIFGFFIMSVSAIEKIMETAFYASEDNSLKYKLSPLSSGTQLSSSAPRRKRFFGSASLVRASIMYPVMMLGWLIFIFLYCILPVGNNSFLVPAPNRSSISSSKVRVKKRGHGQGQSSSASSGGSRTGNAIRSRGTGGGENGRTAGISGNVGGGGQRGGNNGGDEENNGGDVGGNQERDWSERAVMLFVAIMGLIQQILNLCGAELSSITTTGSVIGYYSVIISLLALVFYEVVRRQPLNGRVARILNPRPRVLGILGATGSAFAVLGFISRLATDLPLHLSSIFIPAFLFLLIMYLVDILLA